jgi:hypothetical protein
MRWRSRSVTRIIALPRLCCGASPADAVASVPAHRRRLRLAARLFMAVAAVALLLGAWGCFKGFQTLNWPQVEAKIQGGDVRSAEADAQAPAAVYYSYAAGGAEYLSYGIQPDPFAVPFTALRRAQAKRYPPNRMVQAVSDPDDPSIAYLEPGPGDASKVLIAAGVGFAVAGLWLRRRARVATRANKQA